MFSILIIVCCGEYLFWSSPFGVLHVFCTLIIISLRLKTFSFMILLKIFPVHLTWLSFSLSIPIDLVLFVCLFLIWEFLDVLCLEFFFLFNIFFDWDIPFFYPVFSAWVFLFHFLYWVVGEAYLLDLVCLPKLYISSFMSSFTYRLYFYFHDITSFHYFILPCVFLQTSNSMVFLPIILVSYCFIGALKNNTGLCL